MVYEQLNVNKDMNNGYKNICNKGRDKAEDIVDVL